MELGTVVFKQDPFGYGCSTDIYNTLGGGGPWIHGFGLEGDTANNFHQSLKATGGSSGFDDSSASSTGHNKNNIMGLDTNSSSQENYAAGKGFSPVAGFSTVGRRKRRRSRSIKQQEEVERQRMTHITVERNRRKQMNDYLCVLRSMMPPSYVQRFDLARSLSIKGDQASIIGGAINFVKELEQLIQSLEAHKQNKEQEDTKISPYLFSDFFSFPQYSARLMTQYQRNCSSSSSDESLAKKGSLAIADVEVKMVESHANLKILSRKHPKQLLKMVTGLYSLDLTVLHLNVTTVDDMALYCISVKVEDQCQLTSVNEIAAAVYDLVGRIQEEAVSNFFCAC